MAAPCFIPWCDAPEVPGNGCCRHHARLEWGAAAADAEVTGRLPVGAEPHGDLRRGGLEVVGRLVVRCEVLEDGALDGSVSWVVDPPRVMEPWTPDKQRETLRRLALEVTGLGPGEGRNNALARVAFTVGGMAGAGHGDPQAALEWLVELARDACPDERWKAIRTVRRQFLVGLERPMREAA